MLKLPKESEGTWQEALENLGFEAPFSRQALSGGDINQAWKLIDARGQAVFLKSRTCADPLHFSSEVQGLEALRLQNETLVPKAFHIPEIHAWGKKGNDHFLLMEYVKPLQAQTEAWERAGLGLARLHQSKGSSKTYGFPSENRLGLSPQINTPEANWAQFFAKHRLEFQILRAQKSALIPEPELKALEKLCQSLPDILPAKPSLSLLHGDLWSGNIMFCSTGPVLIDPAVYWGDSEADLAMTELFTAFPQAFYNAYYSLKPRHQGDEQRKAVYKIYHLLNHLNLFGASYLKPLRSQLVFLKFL